MFSVFATEEAIPNRVPFSIYGILEYVETMANIHLNRQQQRPLATSLLVTSLMLLGMFALIPLSSSAQSGTSTLTVTSQDTSGNAIHGYYTALYQGGSEVASGFTPATYTLNNGGSYVIQADSYGNCFFQSWNNGNTSSSIKISITSNTQITAIYNCGASSSSSVTVYSKNQNNNSIFGYYTVLYNSAGSVVKTGFTTATFATTSGLAYGVQVSNYGSCAFAHWSDGVTADPRSFTATSGAQFFTAIYNCTGTTGGGGGTGGASNVTINSVDQNGNGIHGYYTILKGSSGTTTGFTNVTFATTSGQTYSVQVDGYGSCSFNNWAGGSTSNPMTFTATNKPQTFTAVYSCGGTHPTGITIFDHRIPASYWAPCFATQCTNPLASCNTSCTGPGASMYFTLYDAHGNVVATGFADESGKTITGLTPGAVYYIYPADCDLCHGSTHDVLFHYWGTSQGTEINSTRPLQVTVGETVNAWYNCTNGCGGG
jgi:hypothetical protein